MIYHDRNFILVLLFFTAVILLSVVIYLFYRRTQAGKPNRGSVKEALDTLPTALCYFTPSGTVKLCNKQMELLFRAFAQTDLQYYGEFKAALSACNGVNGIKIEAEEPDTYLFPDGKAWHYTETVIRAGDGLTYTEAMFSDVTELYRRGLELKEQTVKLRRMSNDLKKLSDNALIITHERELLNTKTRLHDQMGAGLTALRQVLMHTAAGSEADAALLPLRRAVGVFKNDNAAPLADNTWNELLQDARSVGIEIILNGVLPKQEDIYAVLLLAIRECLTNAARYADASELYITANTGNGAATVCVANNGAAPAQEVRPKGGLKNLQRHIINLGGQMSIRSFPAFELTVTLPAEKENAE